MDFLPTLFYLCYTYGYDITPKGCDRSLALYEYRYVYIVGTYIYHRI